MAVWIVGGLQGEYPFDLPLVVRTGSISFIFPVAARRSVVVLAGSRGARASGPRSIGCPYPHYLPLERVLCANPSIRIPKEENLAEIFDYTEWKQIAGGVGNTTEVYFWRAWQSSRFCGRKELAKGYP